MTFLTGYQVTTGTVHYAKRVRRHGVERLEQVCGTARQRQGYSLFENTENLPVTCKRCAGWAPEALTVVKETKPAEPKTDKPERQDIWGYPAPKPARRA